MTIRRFVHTNLLVACGTRKASGYISKNKLQVTDPQPLNPTFRHDFGNFLLLVRPM